MLLLLSSSVIYTYFVYPPPDYKTESEKIEFAKFLHNNLDGTSIDEIVLAGEGLGLKYLVIGEQQTGYNFIDEIYEEEKLDSYLTKVFDSNEHGFENLNVKIFKIDYKLFKDE